mmetsp:Transcript_109244/g.326719  ORF Transcript_109244/g.326719 Transcript_109244/m.326719 type:complete len:201 (-) Transcript_109244:44-646(-)
MPLSSSPRSSNRHSAGSCRAATLPQPQAVRTPRGPPRPLPPVPPDAPRAAAPHGSPRPRMRRRAARTPGPATGRGRDRGPRPRAPPPRGRAHARARTPAGCLQQSSRRWGLWWHHRVWLRPPRPTVASAASALPRYRQGRPRQPQKRRGLPRHKPMAAAALNRRQCSWSAAGAARRSWRSSRWRRIRQSLRPSRLPPASR